MSLGDIPRISNSNYTNSTYSMMADGGLQSVSNTAGLAGGSGGWLLGSGRGGGGRAPPLADAAAAQVRAYLGAYHNHVDPQKGTLMAKEGTLRLVRVIIADTDKNIPLDKRVLYAGEEKGDVPGLDRGGMASSILLPPRDTVLSPGGDGPWLSFTGFVAWLSRITSRQPLLG